MLKPVSFAPAQSLSANRRKLVTITWAILIKCVFALAAFASAQEPKPHSWQNVITLPAGTKVDVKARSQHIHCFFTSADEKALTCTPVKSGPPVIIDRLDIRSVKIGHRGRSAVIGAGVGGGSLAIAGFAATTGGGDSFFGPNFLRAQVTGYSALIGGILGGSIGALTDFSKSTVYSAH